MTLSRLLHTVYKPAIFCLFTALICSSIHAEETLVDPWEGDWKYLDDGSDPGASWRDELFDDSQWSAGVASLGYGYPGGISTVINAGPENQRHITSYYRRSFTVADASIYVDLGMSMLRDDGIVVYINGTEVFRNNMPAGTVNFETQAVSEINVEESWLAGISTPLPASVIHNGINVIAVEVHQFNHESNDAVFALMLTGNYPPSQPGIFSRGPYLQMITPTSAIVRWGTKTKSDSVVNFGLTADSLVNTVSDNISTYHHEVKLTGLSPNTTYYYDVGSSSSVTSSGADHFFKTQPLIGSHLPTRIWVIGDSGRGDQDQRNVYQGYINYAAGRYTDLWLLLGDNAYGSGTDQQYQDNFFKIYPSLLHQTVVWPSLGNHDGASVDTPAQTGVYYNIFSLPKAAEAGGVASGTEAYYSYNYGNMHFVVLDAYDVDRSQTGEMAQWLEADLTANTADWVVAYWHHPPYSKGSHDSDYEIELIEMRQNILPILENHGVDLVLCGHSHSYERSKFVDGHYGQSNTYLDALFALDIGSGNMLNGAPAYTKAHPAVPHGGTVYAVVGTSAQAQGDGALNHPVMQHSSYTLGSMVIDVDNLALTARFVGVSGEVQDAFTIQKLAAGSDNDGDGIANGSDNCALVANFSQLDTNSDGQGDTCDTDDDGDGINDAIDADSMGVFNNADYGHDDDGDGVPNNIDADALNASIRTESALPFNGAFKGSLVKEALERQ